MSAVEKHSSDTPPDDASTRHLSDKNSASVNDIRLQAKSITYLPIPQRISNHILRISQDPESMLDTIHDVVTCDGSLTSLFLSLANQPPFCMNRSTTQTSKFTNQLGLEATRTLATAYTLVGRYNTITIPAELQDALWSASLFKACVAGEFMTVANPSMREQAFICGLLQDIFVPWMTIVSPATDNSIASVADIFRSAESENNTFGCNHAELGGQYLSRLGLPEVYCNAVTFQHDLDALKEHIHDAILAEAVFIAAKLPHILDNSRSDYMTSIREEVGATVDLHGLDPEEFWSNVRLKFDSIQKPISQHVDSITTEELLQKTCSVHAAGVTILVRNMSSVLTHSADIAAKATGLRSQCDQLETKATRDQLTGILNRAGFTELTEKRLKDAGVLNLPVALVYCDCNKFKQINDNHGHDFGDQALIIAANAMSKVAKKFDVVGRLGGDEFVLLLFDRTKEQAVEIVRQVLADVASQTIRTKSEEISFTLSAGIAYTRPHLNSCTLDELLRQGDQLMYEAKKGDGEKLRVIDMATNETPELTQASQGA